MLSKEGGTYLNKGTVAALWMVNGEGGVCLGNKQLLAESRQEWNCEVLT